VIVITPRGATVAPRNEQMYPADAKVNSPRTGRTRQPRRTHGPTHGLRKIARTPAYALRTEPSTARMARGSHTGEPAMVSHWQVARTGASLPRGVHAGRGHRTPAVARRRRHSRAFSVEACPVRLPAIAVPNTTWPTDRNDCPCLRDV